MIKGKKKSFQLRLFLSVGGIFLIFVLFFSIFQYNREKNYKENQIENKLQLCNHEIFYKLGKEALLKKEDDKFIFDLQNFSSNNLRITILDLSGNVLRDNICHDISKLENHSDRKEIKNAIEKGTGNDIKRESECLEESYFYSATKFDDIIIRTAVPYTSGIAEYFETDKNYILYILSITALLGWVLFHNIRRISSHVEYLNQFATKTETGESIDPDIENKLPNDELGEISKTIVSLYRKLKLLEEDKQRMKKQLTQNVTHELKTPATSIQGFLETILQNPDIPEEKKNHFLKRCLAQSERMCQLLANMDSLTKLDDFAPKEVKNDNIIKKEVDVNSIIHAAIDDTMLQGEEKDILTTLDIPANITVLGDASLIYSIFRNLIDNSIAYAVGATTIDISCTKKGKNYEFVVSDNGCGVPEEHLPHIFERFYRVDKGRTRKMGGTGLGLAIVKNAVILHNGNITAYTTPGGGLSVKFTLPTFS
jgi:signal transduction histidine kinase